MKKSEFARCMVADQEGVTGGLTRIGFGEQESKGW